jgi:hypothetical protein
MIIYSPTLSGSTILSGSLKVSGSVFFKNTIIGSSSYALRSLTASYSLKSGAGGTTLQTGSTYPITSSYAGRSITASYALNASGGSSLSTGSSYPITSSYATFAINALTNYTIATLSGTSINWTNNTLEKNVSTSETYTFTNVGTGSAIVVILNNTGSNNVLPTFPVTVKWANSLYPTNILPSATSIYTFLRSNNYILGSSTENYQ